MKNQIMHGNNLEVLKSFADNSIDSIVTDPPYGLSFMNKHWDYDVPQVELWKECFRVLKPGGHLLSFAGTRTYHRMTVRIEDAGFEIRDMISWLYGSGFPKSLDISKAIDKQNGAYVKGEVSPNSRNSGASPSGCYSEGVQNKTIDIPQSPEAIQWNGWGTALKPACEPICVARKPIEETVANNVLKYGTGGLNIDGCRIGITDKKEYDFNNNGLSRMKRPEGDKLGQFDGGWKIDKTIRQTPQGRFPANIIFDEIAGVMLDEMSGELKSGAMTKPYKYTNNGYSLGAPAGETKQIHDSNSGGASRFFYCAKASKSERNGGLEGFEEKSIDIQQPHNSKELQERYEMKSKNFHPTVKPLKLMQYLVRLVTPPNGICLDPFCGSGTTLMACVKEGFNYIGLEREADYVKIAEARIEWVKIQKKESDEELTLFDNSTVTAG